jgi:hypothetical protein
MTEGADARASGAAPGQLVGSPDRRLPMGTSARRRMEATLNPLSCGRALTELIEAIAGRGGPEPCGS